MACTIRAFTIVFGIQALFGFENVYGTRDQSRQTAYREVNIEQKLRSEQGLDEKPRSRFAGEIRHKHSSHKEVVLFTRCWIVRLVICGDISSEKEKRQMTGISNLYNS